MGKSVLLELEDLFEEYIKTDYFTYLWQRGIPQLQYGKPMTSSHWHRPVVRFSETGAVKHFVEDLVEETDDSLSDEIIQDRVISIDLPCLPHETTSDQSWDEVEAGFLNLAMQTMDSIETFTDSKESSSWLEKIHDPSKNDP